VVEHEICADSGALPTEYCPSRRWEVFAEDQPPLDQSNDWYQMVKVDAFTNLLVNEFCPNHVIEQLMAVISDPRGREWAQAHPELLHGVPLSPIEFCDESTGRPEIFISQPSTGVTVQGIVPVFGTVQMPNFDHYDVQYGVGASPQGWGWISGPHLAQVRDGWLAEWDTTHLKAGEYTLLITAFDRNQYRVEARVRVYVENPTPTPTMTATPTETPTPSPTPTLGVTPSPTVAQTPERTPTVTPLATATQAPTPTIAPTSVVTASQSVSQTTGIAGSGDG
jgi:hypothetical protein